MTDQTPAQIAYEAYGNATGALTHDGRPMPAWDDLGDRIQHAWAAAALACGIEREMPHPAYGAAWAKLAGYVQQAIEDGGSIAPQSLAAYMQELKQAALAPVRDWVKHTAERKATCADEPSHVPSSCPHCPDGHANPARGTWHTRVAPDLDGDGQPTRILVERPAGQHVADADADWIRARLNPGDPS